MNTDIEKQAQQLELAAQLLRTGHPWEWDAKNGKMRDPDDYHTLGWCIANAYEIRPVLVTPDDGRKLNNPDNLTAEQVGVGYKLTLEEQMDGLRRMDCNIWNNGNSEWRQNKYAWYWNKGITIRIPLSTPWPEAKPAWTMPEPPAGKQWHKPGALTQQDWEDGWRPCLIGEQTEVKDQWSHYILEPGEWSRDNIGHQPVIGKNNLAFRTKRPLPVEPVKPEPKYGPLEQSDILLGDAVKRHDDLSWALIVVCTDNGVEIAESNGSFFRTFTHLFTDGWTIKHVGQTEWQPCRKEVQP